MKTIAAILEDIIYVSAGTFIVFSIIEKIKPGFIGIVSPNVYLAIIFIALIVLIICRNCQKSK